MTSKMAFPHESSIFKSALVKDGLCKLIFDLNSISSYFSDHGSYSSHSYR